jgi:hypothetical protein
MPPARALDLVLFSTYGAAAALCAALGLAGSRWWPGGGRPPERRLWAALGLLLLGLLLLRALGLDVRLTNISRVAAAAEGLYRRRTGLQETVSSAAIAGCAALAALAAWRTRRAAAYAWPALLGAALAAGIVALRTVSLHDTDAWLGARVWWRASRGLLLELAGAGTVATAAAARLWSARRRTAP